MRQEGIVMTTPARSRAWSVWAGALLLAALSAPMTPAAADDVATGSVVFTGRAALPVFPCAPPEPGALPCEGTWEGRFTGQFSGVDTVGGERIPWALELDTPGTADFAYADVVEQGLGCTGSVARGRLTFSGGLNQAYGAYKNAPLVPSAIAAATAALDFEWRREGTTGAVLVTSLSLDINVRGVGWVNVIDDDRQVAVADAVATFLPDRPTDCAGGAPKALTGAIQGTLSGLAADVG